MFTAILAGKGEEEQQLPSSTNTSTLLISATSPSTISPSFSSVPTTTKIEPNLSSSTMNDEQATADDFNINLQSPVHQRRLPLPNKLSFEQNITNMIEKESPLLQSELLTAEHELTVLRSRLAVNEGVTAVTGSILASLKEQFEPHTTKVDTATSPLDIYRYNLIQQSSAIQTSPIVESLPEIPESVEIHYDAQTPKSPYLVVKAKNSFWIAQSVPLSEAETQLKKFSSPVMKRATVKLPKSFDQTFLTDSDTEDEQVIETKSKTTLEQPLTIENVRRLSKEYVQQLKQNETSWSTEALAPSVADEPTGIKEDVVVTNEGISPSPTEPFLATTNEKIREQISPENEPHAELKAIRSSSVLTIEDQCEQFDDKIDEIYSMIDSLKSNTLTTTKSTNIQTNINQLKSIMSEMKLNKQDELRIEYELDELENLFRKINDNSTSQIYTQEDYSLIELFEQNVNELRRIMVQIKSKPSEIQPNTTDEEAFVGEQKFSTSNIDWTPEQMAEYFHRGPDGQLLPQKTSAQPHLIPENPVVTRDVFFEGDKFIQEKKQSLTHVTHLIPEDARISADSFYEGDIHRSFYHTEDHKEKHVQEKPLIPESPLVSSDVFYEGDPQRSLFVERSSVTSNDIIQSPPSPPPAIENLRGIMSDLMLAASWSKKPAKLDEKTTNPDEEIIVESFITTEEHHPISSLVEIVHEIENYPLSSSGEQLQQSHPVIQIEERDTISPFTNESPIVIHRSIITRQETDRWTQDDNVTSTEPSVSDLQQSSEDWTTSESQTKEIYGEQYRPTRKFSDTTATIESKQETEEEDVTVTQPIQSQAEQDHIERSWSTDKIIEPSLTEQEAEDEITHESSEPSDHEEEHEHKLERTLSSEEVKAQTIQDEDEIASEEQIISQSPVPSEHEEHEIVRQQSIEQSPTIEQIPISSTQSVEEEEELAFEHQPSFEQITVKTIEEPEVHFEKVPSEEELTFEHQPSFEQVTIKTTEQQEEKLQQSPTIEEMHTASFYVVEDDEYEQEDQIKLPKTPSEKEEEDNEPKLEREPSFEQVVSETTQHKDESDQSPTIESLPIISSPTVEKDVVEHSQIITPDQEVDQYEIIQTNEYSDKTQQSPTIKEETLPEDVESSEFTEHDEEQPQIQLQRTPSEEKVTAISAEPSEHEDEQLEQLSTTEEIPLVSSHFTEDEQQEQTTSPGIEQLPITSEDVTEKEIKLPRTPSEEKVTAISAEPSEHEDDQQEQFEYKSERQPSVEQIISPTTEQLLITSKDITEEEVKLSRTPSHEEIVKQLPQSSEHEDKLEQSSFIEEGEEELKSVTRSSVPSEHEEQLQQSPTIEQIPITSSHVIEDEELKTHSLEEEEPFKHQLSSEQVVPETIELEDQFEAEPEVRSERSLSSEKVAKKSPQHSDNEDEFLHITEQERQSERELERKLSSGKISVKSDQGGYHEEEEDTTEHVVTNEPEQSLSGDDKKTVIVSHEDIQEDQSSTTSEKAVIHEQPIEHDDDDDVVAESSQLPKTPDIQTTISSLAKEQQEHEVETLFNTVKFIVSSAPSSSEEERESYVQEFEQKYHEQQYQLAQHQQAVDQSRFTQTNEEKEDDEQHQYERPLSTGQVGLNFSQQDETENDVQTPEKVQLHPFETTISHDESTGDFEREISNESFSNLETSSYQGKQEGDDDDDDQNKPLKRSEDWTQSDFQRKEIYGNQYRPSQYSVESPELETQISSEQEKPVEQQSPIISHIQRSSIISRTIASYRDDEEVEDQEESEFRPTHLDISVPNEPIQTPDTETLLSSTEQYEQALQETSTNMIDQILDDAVRETADQEQNYSLYQAATDIVNNVIDNLYTKYDDEIVSSQREEATSADVSISDLTDWSSLVKNVPDVTVEEKPQDESLVSDDEEKEKEDKVFDIITSKTTEQLGDLVGELQELDEQINESSSLAHSKSYSSSSSLSDNDEIHHYDLHAHETKITTTTTTDTLAQDIIEYRRDSQASLSETHSHHIERRPSSPPSSPVTKQDFVQITYSSMNDVDEVQQQLQDELEETQVLQSLIDTIIKEAQEQVQGEVSVMKNRS